MIRSFLKAGACALGCWLGSAVWAQESAPEPTATAAMPAEPTPTPAPGYTPPPGFDYWVLLLSWSPEYCRLKPSDPECKGYGGYREPFGFVVHGVRPRFEVGAPVRCQEDAEPLSDELIERAVMLMPSPQLVRSEWRRHGTCSGMSPEEYFIFVERAARRIEIPPEYRELKDYLTTDLDTVKRRFLRLNPDLTDDSIALRCSRRWLKEISVCFDNEMQPRSCGRDIDDRCRAGKITLRPIKSLPMKQK